MNPCILTVKSIAYRPLSFVLTLVVLFLSFVLLMSVNTLQRSVPLSFENAISGTDLIVGAGTGSVSLLLYAAFRIGYPGANISYALYEQMRTHPDVKSAIPISLGDSHQGYPVLATTDDYFEHFTYGDGTKLELDRGQYQDFSQRIDTVILGNTVARELGYELGRHLTISHGMDEVSFEEHENVLFEVTGILAKTGTPVDRSLHITLEGLKAVHVGWTNLDADSSTSQAVLAPDKFAPTEISTLLLSMHSKLKIFAVKAEIEDNPGYRAILPGVAFSELWRVLDISERILKAIAYLVLFCSLVGMICSMLMSLMLRRRELAIFRALGGRPWFVGQLMLLESLALVVIAAGSAWLVSVLVLYGGADFMSKNWGVYLSGESILQLDWRFISVILGLGLAAGLIPAYMAYRKSIKATISVLT